MSQHKHLKPSGLHNNPAYSHVVVASGARTIYVSGQVSTDEEGRVVGEGDLSAQTTQVMHNLGLALKAAGAGYSNIVKITTFVVGYKPELRPIIGKARSVFFEGIFLAGRVLPVRIAANQVKHVDQDLDRFRDLVRAMAIQQARGDAARGGRRELLGTDDAGGLRR